jgi:hypothetical protein
VRALWCASALRAVQLRAWLRAAPAVRLWPSAHGLQLCGRLAVPGAGAGVVAWGRGAKVQAHRPGGLEAASGRVDLGLGGWGGGELRLRGNPKLCVYIHNDRRVPHVIAGLAGMRVRIAIFLPASNYPPDSSSCPRPRPRAGNGARIRARRVSYPRVRG